MSKVIRLSNPEDRKAPPKRYAVETRPYSTLYWTFVYETDNLIDAEVEYTALCYDPANEKLFIRIVDREAGE